MVVVALEWHVVHAYLRPFYLIFFLSLSSFYSYTRDRSVSHGSRCARVHSHTCERTKNKAQEKAMKEIVSFTMVASPVWWSCQCACVPVCVSVCVSLPDRTQLIKKQISCVRKKRSGDDTESAARSHLGTHPDAHTYAGVLSQAHTVNIHSERRNNNNAEVNLKTLSAETEIERREIQFLVCGWTRRCLSISCIVLVDVCRCTDLFHKYILYFSIRWVLFSSYKKYVAVAVVLFSDFFVIHRTEWPRALGSVCSNSHDVSNNSSKIFFSLMHRMPPPPPNLLHLIFVVASFTRAHTYSGLHTSECAPLFDFSTTCECVCASAPLGISTKSLSLSHRDLIHSPNRMSKREDTLFDFAHTHTHSCNGWKRKKTIPFNRKPCRERDGVRAINDDGNYLHIIQSILF